MYKSGRVGFSPLKVVIIVLLSIIIAISIIVNIIFLKSNTPHDMFGKTLFLMETDDMEPEIIKNTMIIADRDGVLGLESGEVVMYNFIDAENKTITAISRIHDIVSEVDGTYYYLKIDNAEHEETDKVLEKDILAKCSLTSKEFGIIVSTLKNTVGIVLFLILPSVILILLVIASSINARKLRDGHFDDYDLPVMLERMPKKKKRVDSPLFEADDDINSSEDFLAKKNSISENFSQKRINQKPTYQNVDKTTSDLSQKKVLFDVNNNEDVKMAKEKTNERLKKAEFLNPQDDFSEYKHRDTNKMKPSRKSNPDEGIKFVSQVNTDNVSDISARSNVDEKASAIKLALQKTTFDDASETDTTYIKNTTMPNRPKQATEKKIVAKSKMDDIKNRYINQTKKDISSSKGSATFEDLMKVIESEKKKLD